MHIQTPFYLLKRVLGLVEELKHQRAAKFPLVIVIHLEDLLERRHVDVILKVLEYGRERLAQELACELRGRKAGARQFLEEGWDARYPLTWTW